MSGQSEFDEGVMRIAFVVFVFLAFMPGITMADPATECDGSSQIEIGACVAETLRRADAMIEIYLGFAITSAAELDDITGGAVSVPALETAQSA